LLDLSLNHLLSYEIQNATGAPFIDYANTTGNSVALAQYRWKLFTTIGYAIGPLSTRLSWRHLPSLPNIVPGALPNAAYNELDLYGVWSLGDKLTLRAGVENLADAQPPVVGRIPGVSNNYGITDPTYYDVLGRRYFIGFTARF
jgi:outer membrane receptor protein involved in Fe transport